MSPITFITANFVALPLGFRMRSWDDGAKATADLLRDPDRYALRFGALLDRIVEFGFTDVDLWTGHLDPDWATPRHLETAATLLRERSLRVHTLVGHFGSTVEALPALGSVARAVGCDLLSGGHELLGRENDRLADGLREAGLRLAFENHPETSARAMLGRIGEGNDDVLGIAFDTGWAGSQGFDAVEAVSELAPRLWHVHLKDVLPPRPSASGYQLIDLRHETCALGDGIVHPGRVVERLVQLGFSSPIGIEHEPETHDPTEEIRTSLARLQTWLGA